MFLFEMGLGVSEENTGLADTFFKGELLESPTMIYLKR